MNTRTRLLAWVLAGGALLLGSPTAAEETNEPARFAAPQRILAGGGFAGAGRLYPSW